jgi:hypothetical protein
MAVYEDDDLDDFDGDLPKKLRAQIKQLSKERDALTEELNGFRQQQRTRVIGDVLASRGVNPKVARYVPQDIEVTEESVAAWLAENEDVFGVQSAPAAQQEAPQAPPPEADPFRRMAAVEQNGQLPSPGDLLSKIESAQSEEELFQMLRGGL